MIRVNADLADSLTTLRWGVRQAEHLAAVGDDDQALRLVQAVAEFAWYNPTGLLASSRLEAVCASVGSRLVPVDGAPRTVREHEHVLHVFSEAHHSAGGHVRFPWRWMGLDTHRTHSIAVTNQPAHEGVSPVLSAAALSSGGRVEVLHPASPLTARAQRLRQLASQVDVVVLHVHPYDAVAVAALSTPTGPLRVYVNHADHVFWLGASVTDALASHRPAGTAAAVARRGTDPARTGLLPIIVDPVASAPDRAGARRTLGLRPESTVLLTAAHGYKYSPIDEHHFLDLVRDVVLSEPDVVLVAAGGGKDPSWVEAERALGGRLVLLGQQEDVSVLHRAADVYLDPYPCSSSTSFLEAASHGLPVLSFSPASTAEPLLDAEDFAESGVILRSRTVAEHHRLLTELVRSPQVRRAHGERALAVTTATSTGSGWVEHLEAFLARARTLPRLDRAPSTPLQRPGRLDRRVADLHRTCGFTRPFERSLAAMGVRTGPEGLAA